MHVCIHNVYTSNQAPVHACIHVLASVESWASFAGKKGDNVTTFPRDNGAGYECTHYCFPSAQQTWVFALYRAMALHFGGEVADPTAPFAETAN